MKLSDIFKMMLNTLKGEKQFYVAVAVYSIFISLISVAIPISVQSLVNTVTFGIMVQPIIIITLLLLGMLTFSTVLNTLMTKVIENFNYHFFARTTGKITENLLGSSTIKLVKKNHVSFTHRYFDIMTIQKSMSAVLSEGVYIVLQILFGMLLISLYHPYFLIFDLILLISLYLIWKVFAQNAMNTAVLESKKKYAMASWLSELSRLNILFKRNTKYAIDKSELLTKDYIKTRKHHFRFLLAQIVGLLLLYTILSAFVLGVGGYLVIIGELSLGQLVAAELVVTLILTSLSKSGKLLEKFYDLGAAVDKLNNFNDIKGKEIQVLSGDKVELHLPIQLKSRSESTFSVCFNNENYNLKIENHELKNWFLGTLIGRQELSGGQIILPFKMDNSLSRQESFYRTFYVLSYPEIFHGTILENLKLASNSVDTEEVLVVLENIKLKNKIFNFDDGLDTELYPCGYPLINGDIMLLELARSILLKPKFIVITDIFKILPDDVQQNYINYITQHTDIKLIFLTKWECSKLNIKDLSLEECCK
jgi:putative ABC transport system ATP-binding protein